MYSVTHWEFTPLVVVPMVASAVMYVIGLTRLWRRAGVGRGIPLWAAACFAAGWVTTAGALVTPLAWVSQILFSAHMTQHTLLMLVAAPLMTFGQPLLAWLWAFPDGRRERVAQSFRGERTVRVWRGITAPLTVFLVQACVLWIWHVPALYEAALQNEAIHAAQHLCLVLAGGLFWWAMVYGRYGKRAYGLGVLYVFLTAVHTNVLGALLTVAPRLWYGEYGRQSAAHHIDALKDQQLAGLLMWIPAGTIFILFGLALLAAWLGEAERRVRLGAADTAGRALLGLFLCVVLLAGAGCTSSVRAEAESLTGGSVVRGRVAIGTFGCGSCHEIPGISGATATVGAPLRGIAKRQFLAGRLTNTPAHMLRWIQHPQSVDPGNAMPDVGLTDQDARDISAYLYTLR